MNPEYKYTIQSNGAYHRVVRLAVPTIAGPTYLRQFPGIGFGWHSNPEQAVLIKRRWFASVLLWLIRSRDERLARREAEAKLPFPEL